MLRICTFWKKHRNKIIMGCTKTFRKKTVVMLQKEKEANFLKASADEVIEYSDFEDLKGKLKKI